MIPTSSGRVALILALLLPLPLWSAEPAPSPARYKGKPTDHWAKRLGDPDAAIRTEAVQALAALGPDAKDAVPGLMKTLDDKEPEVRDGAMAALGRIGPAAKDAAPVLLRIASGEDLGAAEVAIQALGGIGPAHDAVVPALVATALDTDPQRRRVARAAGVAVRDMRLAAKAGLPLLKKALAEEGKQKGAIYLLGFLGPDGVREVVAAWDGATPTTRTAILDSLSNAGPHAKGAVPLLAKLIQEEEPPNIAFTILQAIGPDAVPALRVALERAKGNGRLHAIETLGWIGPGAKEAVPALVAALTNRELAIPVEHALKGIGPDAVPALVERLAAPDGRASALSALTRMGLAAIGAAPALVRLLKVDERSAAGVTRALSAIGPAAAPALLEAYRAGYCPRAATVLGELGRSQLEFARAVLPELTKLLKDSDAATRRRAAELLGLIGTNARSALPTLRQTEKDPDDEVHRVAEAAVKAIRRPN